jgi:hypothetical protein
MGTFWDWVAVGARWAGIVVALGVALWLLVILVYGTCVMAKLFTWDLYHHWKYTTRGICPKCKKPAEVFSSPADQLYGPDRIRQLACSCGAPTIPMGNRRGADWAGF